MSLGWRDKFLQQIEQGQTGTLKTEESIIQTDLKETVCEDEWQIVLTLNFVQ